MHYQADVAADLQEGTWLGKMPDAMITLPDVNVGLLERLASLAVGATLILMIARRLILYLGLAAAGGFLLYRGVTGYCPLYAAEDINTRNWNRTLLVFRRSKYNEQDNHARQMATGSWRSENEVGPAHRR